MKCVILLACVAAAHAQLMPFFNYKLGLDVFNLNTGMPMAFLRKKRDLDAMGRVTAIHVPNVMTYGRLGYGGLGMGLGRAIYLRKKRDADQKASSQLFVMDTYGLGLNYDYLHYPFLMRKKRDADQKASSQMFVMDTMTMPIMDHAFVMPIMNRLLLKK